MVPLDSSSYHHPRLRSQASNGPACSREAIAIDSLLELDRQCEFLSLKPKPLAFYDMVSWKVVEFLVIEAILDCYSSKTQCICLL